MYRTTSLLHHHHAPVSVANLLKFHLAFLARTQTVQHCLPQHATYVNSALHLCPMHGVLKGARLSPAEHAQLLNREKTNADLVRRSLLLRNAPLPVPITDEFRSRYRVVEAAVEANPDEYSLWSFRREVLLAQAQQLNSTPHVDDLWHSELSLTMRALRRHPKAYPAWQHRLWLLSDPTVASFVSKDLREKPTQEEHVLSAMMLAKDGRNFHSWAHRMRVRSTLVKNNPSTEKDLEKLEMKFVEKMINADFANYSAWHHRSVLFPRLKIPCEEVISEELEFVEQAFFTEPDVQSVWFYHRWLLAGAPEAGEHNPKLVDDNILRSQLDICNTLIEIEPLARLVLQEKAYILGQLGLKNELSQVLEELEKIDPMRKGYYRYLREKAGK